MSDRHIIKLLEEQSLHHLSAQDRAAVQAHVARCAGCRRAYEAAQVTQLMLRQRAAVTAEPAPFFQTRVMAALREKQSAPEPFAFTRLWQAARSVVAAMVLVVAMLAGLTFFAGGIEPQNELPDVAASVGVDATEQALFGMDDLAADDMSYGQVLNTIYYPEDNGEGQNGEQQ